ncbi:MAG: hypothetical protein Q8N83_06955 [Ignavibacteria bacterium]|nr:hypothetical protein [Ignavibacteria bacterium]
MRENLTYGLTRVRGKQDGSITAFSSYSTKKGSFIGILLQNFVGEN